MVPAGWESSRRKEEGKEKCWRLWIYAPRKGWPFDFAWDCILCPGIVHNSCTVKSSLVIRTVCDTTLPVVEDGISEVQGQHGLDSEFKTGLVYRKLSKTQNPIHPTKPETNSPPMNDWLSLNGDFRDQDQNGIRFSVAQNLPFRTPWHRAVSVMRLLG